MKILFLTKYDRLAANTRYRCLQYLPLLEKQGIECTVSPLLDNDYLKHKFSTGSVKLSKLIPSYVRRFKTILSAKEYDAIVLHYELFPFFPAVFERLLKWLNIKYICDYDDAIFNKYDAHRSRLVTWFLKGKIRKVMKYSANVLAGNQYLADYGRDYSWKMNLLPTVVDMNYYRQVPHRERKPHEPFTIGWIGSPSTSVYVKEKARALRLFCLNHNARLVMVGSGPVDIPGVPLEVREWNEATELEELSRFDVGIMPLPDDPWTRGKCGFKLIQYMACRIPTIASPVGVNTEIVEHGRSGLLAQEDDDWLNALEALYSDDEKRQEMGRCGFERVEKHYSLESAAPKMVQVLQKTTQDSSTLFTNVDAKVADDFGEEWAYFRQNILSEAELRKIYFEYFNTFPWRQLPENPIGADIGCGSGRWANFVSKKVDRLHCVDASEMAIQVSQEHLRNKTNVRYHHASIGNLPFENNSLDFAYCIGVLHHLPDPEFGMKEISKKLKEGAPFLFYIYYAFENRSPLYRALWKLSDILRIGISALPFRMKLWISQLIAMTTYWPLARTAKLLDALGKLPRSWALSYYRDKAFYVMRNDALDRFGTRLEKRFTQRDIRKMLVNAGFERIQFSTTAPYWVGVAYKASK